MIRSHPHGATCALATILGVLGAGRPAHAQPTMGLEWEMKNGIAVTAVAYSKHDPKLMQTTKDYERVNMPQDHDTMKLFCTVAKSRLSQDAKEYPDVSITYDLEDSEGLRTLEIVTAPFAYADEGAWRSKVMAPVAQFFASVERFAQQRCGGDGPGACEVYAEDFWTSVSGDLPGWAPCGVGVGEYNYVFQSASGETFSTLIEPKLVIKRGFRMSALLQPGNFSTHVNLAVPLRRFADPTRSLYTTTPWPPPQPDSGKDERRTTTRRRGPPPRAALTGQPDVAKLRAHVITRLQEMKWLPLDATTLAGAAKALATAADDLAPAIKRWRAPELRAEDTDELARLTEAYDNTEGGSLQEGELIEQLAQVRARMKPALQRAEAAERRQVDLRQLIADLGGDSTSPPPSPSSQRTPGSSHGRLWLQPRELVSASAMPRTWGELTADEQAFLVVYYTTLNAEIGWTRSQGWSGKPEYQWQMKNYFDVFTKAPLDQLLVLAAAGKPERLGQTLQAIAAADPTLSLCLQQDFVESKNRSVVTSTPEEWCDQWITRDSRRRVALVRSRDPWLLKETRTSDPVRPWRVDDQIWMVVELRLDEGQLNRALSPSWRPALDSKAEVDSKVTTATALMFDDYVGAAQRLDAFYK